MRKKHIIGLIALVILLTALPLAFNRAADFSGADSRAQTQILADNPGYKPWAESPIRLPGAETESLLFSLQAAAGAGVLAYGLGYMKGRRKGREEGRR